MDFTRALLTIQRDGCLRLLNRSLTTLPRRSSQWEARRRLRIEYHEACRVLQAHERKLKR